MSPTTELPAEFTGTRAELQRVATHVLAFEGESQVRWFEGNFSEYEAFRHKELGVDADTPHRLKYKPLVRG